MSNNTVNNSIIKAALKTIATKTISGTRMLLIAEEAGMATSNIHYHFKTKRDLLLSVLDEIQRRSFERRKVISESAQPTLRGMLEGFFTSKKNLILHEKEYDTVQFDFWTQGIVDTKINASFQRSYSLWRNDINNVIEKYRPNICSETREYLARIMVSMMVGASMQYHNSLELFDLDRYFDVCLDMILMEIDGNNS